MSKKASFAYGIVITAVIGLIVIGLVVTGPLRGAYKVVSEKVFPQLAPPEEEQDFMPYVEPELTGVDKKVVDSMNALVCALNSVAIGEFKPDDPSVCPRGLPGQETPPQQTASGTATLTPVGSAIYRLYNKITGAAVAGKTAKFGEASVTCEGASSETIILASKDNKYIHSWQDDFDYWTDAREYAIRQVSNAVVDCWNKHRGTATEDYYHCATLAVFPLLAKDESDYGNSLYVDESDIIEQLDWGKTGFFFQGEWMEYDDDVVDTLAHERRGTRIYIERKVGHPDLGAVSAGQYAPCRESLNTKETEKICAESGIPNHENVYCVYFDTGKWSRDTILISSCQKDIEVVDDFSCTVKGFELPQDIGTTIADVKITAMLEGLIGAVGDPKWLVSYEAFPPEAAGYWRKNFFSSVFSLDSLKTVVISGTLNLAFSGGLSKGVKAAAGAARKIAGREGVEKIASASTKIVKEGIEEVGEQGAKEIGERLVKNGAPNTVRSIMVEESVQQLSGVNPTISRRIGDRIMSVVGKSSGESFEKVEKEVAEGIRDVVSKEITDVSQVPEEFIKRVQGPEGYIVGETGPKALQEYREFVSKEIMENLDIGGQKGVKGLFANKLAKEAAEAALRRQSGERFFATFFKANGEVNEKLLEETAESGLKRIGKLNALSDKYSDFILKRGWAAVDDLLAGTIGGQKGVRAAKVIAQSIAEKKYKRTIKGMAILLRENMPIKFASKKWVLTGPGYVKASIAKTTVNMPSWIAKHRYPMLVLLGAVMIMNDAENEYLNPVGGNSVSLYTPIYYGALAETPTWELHDDALKYFIRNQDKKGDRLYLVSPCKTDLIVTKKKCDCVSNPMMHRFNFGGTGLMDVKPNTIYPKSESEIRSLLKEDLKEFINVPPEKWGYSKYSESVLYLLRVPDLWEAHFFLDAYKKSLDAGQSKERAKQTARETLVRELSDIMQEDDPEEAWSLPEKLVPGTKPSDYITYDNLIDQYYEKANSVDDAVLELAIEYWLVEIRGVYDNLVQSKTLGMSEETKVTWFGSERTMDTSYKFFKPYEKYFETSNLIKECSERDLAGYMGSVIRHDISFYREVLGLGSKQKFEENHFNYPTYNVGCLELEPDGVTGYCYDYYPAQKFAKNAMMVAMIAVDVGIIAITGGTAAPAVFFFTGACAGAWDVVISATEFWPLRGTFRG